MAKPTTKRTKREAGNDGDGDGLLQPSALIARVEGTSGRVTIARLREVAARCHGCELYKNATQTVFGDGRIGGAARVMFVGEQPGDREDIEGKPFVGPAGRMLDDALVLAGIERASVYVTNAVKHFKFEPRGKRRLHKKPGQMEISACRPWLDEELRVVKPKVLVALGATAAQALFGRTFKVTQRRGEIFVTEMAPHAMATVHPSSLLRAPDPETRAAEKKKFVEDLKRIAPLLS